MGTIARDIVVLLNNDTEASPQWLEEIRKASQSFPRAGSFASKMLYFDERNRIDNCGFGLTAAGLTVDLGRDERDGPAWASSRGLWRLWRSSRVSAQHARRTLASWITTSL